MSYIKILKFGGSSVGTPDMIRRAGDIVKKERKKNRVGVVVSAFQGVTDDLLKPKINLHDLKARHETSVKTLLKNSREKNIALQRLSEIFKELEETAKKERTPKNLDLMASFGERLSAYIVAAYFQNLPSLKNTVYLDAREIIKTDGNFGNAAVDFNATNKKIRKFFLKNPKKDFIITGFIGSNDKNETTTLGRGGSDYTAAIFGAALKSPAIQIWTDVSGIMSADPKIARNAVPIPYLSYEEAIELAYFGAKVIHPATMLPAIRKKIPVIIKNTFAPNDAGTIIGSGSGEKKSAIKGISVVDGVSLLNVRGVSLQGIPGSAARVFKATHKAGVNVILISQASSEHTICLAVKSGDLKQSLVPLKNEFKREIKNGEVGLDAVLNQAIVAMVGDGMRGAPGVSGKLFGVLGARGINVSAIAQGGSERNISFVINSKDKNEAVNLIHERFFRNGAKNIFLAGAGNIGGELLKQIGEFCGGKLKIRGVINKKNMATGETEINLKNWRKTLEKGDKADFKVFLERVKSAYFPDKIFVDCTASESIAKKYLAIVKAGCHIVAANKIFNALPMKSYSDLRALLAKQNLKFHYETNVGAALPIISTLKDLIATGDKVTRLDGLFSGTLGYLFSHYDGEKPFSELVKDAQIMGFTEPDPRDDLSGEDVRKKLLILARETGLSLELNDIKIQSLIPAPLKKTKSVDEFLKNFSRYDDWFLKLFLKAKNKNMVLRYVASIKNGRCGAILKEIAKDNPLVSAKETDNIFVFYTNRYAKRPIVIQGPGAGREVTAAGVLGDILKI